jgi:hypothetical protein
LNICVEKELEWIPSEILVGLTHLSPQEINDAIDYLESIGAIRVERGMGTHPFNFFMIGIEGRGRYLYHEIKERIIDPAEDGVKGSKNLPDKPLNPVGSPFGFTENDWETVALQKGDKTTLFVVMGLKFKSNYYDTDNLVKSIEEYFNQAIILYNSKHPEKIQLKFDKLEAGYGTHLFNSIASSIIGSDIAVFDTSDHNPNVMIELGVSLTWGIRVLLIREKDSPDIPSDISGQTWIKYEDSGKKILDDKFSKQLEVMITRAIASK